MRFSERNAVYVREFDRYIVEHPDFAEQIPQNALVVLQIKGDDEFNDWARQAVEGAREGNQPVVFVTITELKPVRSRIEKLHLERSR